MIVNVMKAKTPSDDDGENPGRNILRQSQEGRRGTSHLREG